MPKSESQNKDEIPAHLCPNPGGELAIRQVGPGTDFTGIARSIQAYLTNGEFKNYKILTLHIQKGKVIKCEYSDPFASFEAKARLEMATDISLMHLADNWVEGKTLEK
jgi:hypothetical protein